jgi:hypothetical protein
MTALVAIALLASSCIETGGDRILARDLAGVVPEFVQIPPDVPFGLAPRPGVQRIVRPTELKAFASRWGVEVNFPDALCVTGRLRAIGNSEAESALRSPAQSILGVDTPIEVLAVSGRGVPEGELVFPPAAWSAEGRDRIRWRGYVVSASGARHPVWAVVRADRAKIARPVRQLTPREVKAGDRVGVIVRMGAARLSLEALAETSGRMGERITLKNPESGRRFSAVVTGPGQARVGEENDRKN